MIKGLFGDKVACALQHATVEKGLLKKLSIRSFLKKSYSGAPLWTHHRAKQTLSQIYQY